MGYNIQGQNRSLASCVCMVSSEGYPAIRPPLCDFLCCVPQCNLVTPNRIASNSKRSSLLDGILSSSPSSSSASLVSNSRAGALVLAFVAS